uniref:phage tail tape measure protein n=1 Tax=Halomonas sp. TaxID=1486246 RepID=UPI00261D67D4|nr:phage tail tape measure protein [Halomonas sp.]
MAKPLKLEVLLGAIDKATGPLKKITQGSNKTAQALKASRDELRSLEAAQKNLRGFTNLKRNSEQTARALDDQQRQVRELTQQIRNAEGPTRQLTRQREAAIRKARELKQQYAGEQQQLQQLRSRMRQVSDVNGSLNHQQGELARRVRDANQQIAQQQTRLKRVADQQRRATQASRAYGRTMGHLNRMAGVGATGVATGGAALYGSARMLTPGVDYGAAISRVQALTRLGKDDPLMQALRDQARELGSSTSFSATQAADAQGFLAMAGFDPDAIMAAMPDMLDLAKANGTDLGRTADISSNILSGFGLDPEQMGRVGDVLTATTTRANVNLEMLGESMKYVAPQARAMGVSIEEAAAMAGLLGNVGIQGSQAGTTLRAMMTRLAAPTGNAAGALQELGVNAKDAEGNLRNVPKILADVAKATENMGNADRAAYLKDIFGEEPGAGMAELIAQQGAAGVEKFVEILENAAGENARVAKTMADNIQGDLQGLGSAWEEIGITITDTNEGPLRQLIQNVTDITRAVGNWMKENPRLTSTLTTIAAVLAAVVSAGGALTMMLASILGPIAMVRYALTLLSLNPVSLTIMAIVAACAALAGAAYLVYRNWDKISAWFSQRWEDVKAAFSGGIGDITRLILNWSPLGLLWRGISTTLATLGIEVPAKFSTLGGAIIDGLVSGITGGLSRVGDIIMGLGNSIKNWFKETLGIHSPSRVFAGFGANLLDGLINGINERWQTLRDAIGNTADAVVSWFKEKLGIHSPSRVFAELGVHTIDGLNAGLDRQHDEPAKRVRDIAQRVAKAGAGLAIGSLAVPAMADVSIDRRPALTAPAPSAQVPGDNITIHVHGSPSQDVTTLAQEVYRILEQRDRQKAARRRSSLRDID